jgi:RNA polymerase sigma-70 factor (ECF subfamily)
LATGSTQELEQLYTRYAHLVYRRCLILLGDAADAEDAMQEVFVKAYQALDRFRAEAAPSSWLYRISTNHCLNLLRSRRRRRRRLERQAAEAGLLERVDGDKLEAAAVVRELLPRFDRRTQRMAVYYFVDGMSQQEVAAQIGASVPTVRKYLKKFIQVANRRAGSGGER